MSVSSPSSMMSPHLAMFTSAPLVFTFKSYGDTGTCGKFKVALFVENDNGFVLCGVNLDVIMMGLLFGIGTRDDLYRLTGGKQTIHARRGYAYTLLAAAHFETVKFASVQEPCKNIGNLLLNNAGAVVPHHQNKFVVRYRFYTYQQLREDVCLFTGIK